MERFERHLARHRTDLCLWKVQKVRIQIQTVHSGGVERDDAESAQRSPLGAEVISSFNTLWQELVLKRTSCTAVSIPTSQTEYIRVRVDFRRRVNAIERCEWPGRLIH